MNPEEIDAYLERLKTGTLFATYDSIEQAQELMVAAGTNPAALMIYHNTLIEQIRGYIAGGSE